MVMIILLMILLPHIYIHGFNTRHACIPNSQFFLNGKVCFCDQQGWWDESFCLSVRRRTCLPGQIIWQGCSQCICQQRGQLSCNDAGCYANGRGLISSTIAPESLDASASRCTPFNSYYINCALCICPASGKTSEANCTTDNSCQQLLSATSNFLMAVNRNVCIPRVMYLFPCFNCLCSDGGHFLLDKCVDTCHRTQITETMRRCISKTFYRKNCNVCWCPGDSTPTDKFCTKAVCNQNSMFRSLEALKAPRAKCQPNKFATPKCFYCTCNANGNINEGACLELDCLKTKDFNYDVLKSTCSPGEIIPICFECYCLSDGMTNNTYCTNVCSYQNKLRVLESVLRDNVGKENLITKETVKSTPSKNCEPNTMYLDHGRYCLCPNNGSTNFKLCTSYTDDTHSSKPTAITRELNMSCTPNTFVQIDCNSCYCSKNGTLDLRWCTFDDCEAKRVVQLGQENIRVTSRNINPNETCVSGSITKEECNYCICPKSGFLIEKACTKNKCSEVEDVEEHKFICEPLHYYLVDCNVCLCPRNGVKNVERCTKKMCTKTIIRSANCVPGQFFSAGCNVCVCPPNGDKGDSVCTKHKCPESESTWKNVFRLPQNLLSNRLEHGTKDPPHEDKRNLDICFSGEEFEKGCKVCVCSEVGLRSYATCSEAMCDENKIANNTLDSSEPVDALIDDGSEVGLVRSRRDDQNCQTINMTDSSEQKHCTPGSTYIIRCQQCVCPYMGNINLFCRPLPRGQYCEQAFPTFNFLPMGRRKANSSSAATSADLHEPRNHNHTKYSCKKPGKVADECFVCECEEDLNLVEEHCYRSDAANCNNTRPSFLDSVNKVVFA